MYDNQAHNLLDDDLFGTIDKANAIKYIFENNMESLKKNNMIALYGEWGSGKSSIAEFLAKHNEKYEAKIFESWKYENDTNLSLSLLDFIIDEFHDCLDESVIDEFKTVFKTLFTLGKNMVYNSSVSFLGVSVDTGSAAKDTLEELKKNEISYYEKIKEFETQFSNIISKISEKLDRPLLMIIDDLDRCSPDNILSLLSSIKHFMKTDNIVYLSTLDKLAVEKIVCHKYEDYINANEYLDKIFDITFNMPRYYDIYGITNDFIEKLKKYDYNVDDSLQEDLLEFFKDLEVNNPRKIKKVLNKLIYLISLSKDIKIESNYSFLIESINRSNLSFITIIFMIMLFEYENKYYNDLVNTNHKLESLWEVILWRDKGESVGKSRTHRKTKYIENVKKFSRNRIINNDAFKKFHKYIGRPNSDIEEGIYNSNMLTYFYMLLIPKDINNIAVPQFTGEETDNKEKKILDFIEKFKGYCSHPNMKQPIKNQHLDLYFSGCWFSVEEVFYTIV